jgi:hypothetical protein
MLLMRVAKLMWKYSYPGSTLRALELLQQESFRRDILMPETVRRLIEAQLDGCGVVRDER